MLGDRNYSNIALVKVVVQPGPDIYPYPSVDGECGVLFLEDQYIGRLDLSVGELRKWKKSSRGGCSVSRTSERQGDSETDHDGNWASKVS